MIKLVKKTDQESKQDKTEKETGRIRLVSNGKGVTAPKTFTTEPVKDKTEKDDAGKENSGSNKKPASPMVLKAKQNETLGAELGGRSGSFGQYSSGEDRVGFIGKRESRQFDLSDILGSYANSGDTTLPGAELSNTKGSGLPSRVGSTAAGSTAGWIGQLLEAAGTVVQKSADQSDYADMIREKTGNNSQLLEEAVKYEEQKKNKEIQLGESIRELGREASTYGGEKIEEAKDGLGTVGSTAVDFGAASMQMGLDALAGFGNVMPSMLARSFGGGAEEAYEDGADLNQQVRYGLGSAAISYATEQISNVAFSGLKLLKPGIADDFLESGIAKLSEKLASTPSGQEALQTIAKLAVSFAGEGFEEILEDILSPYMKRLTYDADAQSVFQDPDQLGEYLYDGLIGGLMGLAGGASEIAVNRAFGQNAANQTVDDTLLEAAREITANETQENQKSAAPRDAGAKIAENEGNNAPVAQNGSESATDPLTAALNGGNRLERSQMTPEMVKAWAGRDDVGYDAAGKVYQMDPAQHITQRTVEDVGSRSMNAFQFDHPELKRFYQKAAEDLIKDASLSLDTGTGSARTVRTMQGKKYIREILDSPSLRSAMNDLGLTRNEIIQAAEDLIADHGQENYAAAKRLELVLDDMLTNGYTTVEGETVEPNAEYIAATQKIPGYQEQTSEELPLYGPNENIDARIAENQAKIDQFKNMGEQNKRAKVWGKESGVIRDSYVEQMDQNVVNTVDTVAKQLGVKVQFVDSVKGGDANAQIKNGVISIEKNNENPVRFLFGHEITHRMQELDNASYQRLLDAVKADIGEDNLNATIREMQERYESRNVELSEADAMDEITADYVGQFMEGSGYLEKFIESHRTDKTLLEKLRDVFRGLVQKLTGKYKNQASLVEQRLTEAMEASAKEAESLSAQGGKNTAQDGGVKYSIKNTSKMTLAEQLKAFYDGKMASSDSFYFGDTPDTLAAAGLEQLPIAFTQADFKKSTKDKHNVPRRVLKNLNKDLETALFSFGSGDRVGILTGDIDGDGKPLLVGIQLGVQMDADKVNAIRSVYGLDNPAAWLKNQIDAGKTFTLLDEKRANTFLYPYGYLASRKEGIRSLGENLAQDGGNVKPKFSMKDNQGRKLSDEQQKYFKNSKVVDEKGQLKAVYHGSPADFNTFSMEYLGTNGTSEGYGFYFTDKREIADSYSKGTEAQRHQGANGRLYEVYLNIQKPLSDTEVTISRAEFKKFLREMNKQVDEDGEPLEFLSNYGDVSWEGLNNVINTAMEVEYDGSDSDVNMISSIINGCGNMELVYDVLRKTTGYDGIIVENASWGDGQTIYVAFHPEQVKNVDNLNPTTSPDIRYSIKGGESLARKISSIKTEGRKKGRSEADIQADVRAAVDEVYQAMLQEYGAIKPGEKPFRDVQVPKRTDKDKKVSQTVRTILEAQATPDAAIPNIEEMVATGEFSYDVYTDKKAIADADATIRDKGFASALSDWNKSVDKGIVSKANTAEGWALYNAAVNSGDIKSAMDVLNRMVEHQRNAAQAVQATRILKKLSPDAQLYGVQRSVSNLQEEINKRYKTDVELKINQELAEQFMNAATEEERTKALQDIYRDIGRQMPSHFIDKWNAWRYLSMLGNPRTHVRNILGNAGFVPLVSMKNAMATAMESAASAVTGGKFERTKAFVGFGKQDMSLLSAAYKDYGKAQEMVGDGKYSDFANANRYIEEGRVIFKNKALETMRKANSKALSVEDVWFSQPHYAYALAQYCKANGISTEQIRQGKIPDKARQYAIQEAKKATYNDTNALSDFLGKVGRYKGDNKIAKAGSRVVEGILPFRKTPANILARGIEYSPIGLMKSITTDLYQVQKGEMSGAKMMDNLSAGLTGTALMGLGVFLAAQGLVRGGGEDDEKEKKFQELKGRQDYSMELPNGTSITLDWLAPECLPFFVGVNLYEQMQRDSDGLTMSEILSAVSAVSDPMLEMSCLQSLSDVFDSVGYASSQDMNPLVSALASAATSYITQGLPTVFGQLERVTESERMTTYTEKNAFLTGDMQYALGRASGKVPGWDYNQIPYIDAWGRTEASGSVGERAFNNLVNPAYTSQIQSSPMEQELERLYSETSDGGVFPSRAAKYFNVAGERKDLTAEEYVQYATSKGQTSRSILEKLTESSGYKKLDDADKAAVVKSAYELANAKAKIEVSDYQPDGWIAKAIDTTKRYKVPMETYLLCYNAQKGIESIKDEDGDAIANSKGLLVMQMVYNTPGLTEAQRKALFADFGVGQKVIHYNKALVDQKVAELKKKGK